MRRPYCQADLPPRSSWSAWAARTPQLPQPGWYGAHAVSKNRLRRRLSVFSGRVARNGSTCPWLNSAVPPREPGNRMRPPHESTGRLALLPLSRKVKIKIGCPPLIVNYYDAGTRCPGAWRYERAETVFLWPKIIARDQSQSSPSEETAGRDGALSATHFSLFALPEKYSCGPHSKLCAYNLRSA